MPTSFRTKRLVEFSDTDMAGIAHFSAFYRWMESAEHELIRSVGLSIYSKFPGEEEVALSFPRVHASCDFQSPVRCEDVVDIAVRVARLGEKSITYGFTFTNDGKPVAEGKITSVCCRVPPGGPVESIALPGEVTNALRPFLVEQP